MIRSLITLCYSRLWKLPRLPPKLVGIPMGVPSAVKSLSGPVASLHDSSSKRRISSSVSSENYANSILIFLNIISFCVSVPVLSDSKYCTRPSSSGIVEFRAIQP